MLSEDNRNRVVCSQSSLQTLRALHTRTALSPLATETAPCPDFCRFSLIKRLYEPYPSTYHRFYSKFCSTGIFLTSGWLHGDLKEQHLMSSFRFGCALGTAKFKFFFSYLTCSQQFEVMNRLFEQLSKK